MLLRANAHSGFAIEHVDQRVIGRGVFAKAFAGVEKRTGSRFP